MKLPIRRLFFIGVSIVAVLLTLDALHSVTPVYLHEEFNLNKEANLPSWYSSALMLCSALAALGVYFSQRDKGFWRRGFWLAFSLMFIFNSADETAQFHETIAKFTHAFWALYYAPIIGLFFCWCSYYCLVARKDDRELAFWIIGGLVLFALGGVGLEFIQYIGNALHTAWWSDDLNNLEISIEEGLEFLGNTMILAGCLRELSRVYIVKRLE